MKKTFLVLLFSAFVLANCGSSSNNAISGASTVVGNVANDMIPASLAATSTTTGSINISGAPQTNPCTEFVDTYGAASVGACEPKLIRLYLDMIKEFMTKTQGFMEQVGERLSTFGDGTTGTAIAGPNGMTIDYSKTDSTHYSLLIKTAAGASAGYVNVAGQVVTVKMSFADMIAAGAETDATAIGNLEGTMDYTDLNNYTVSVELSGMPCNAATDISAPKNMKVIVTKTAGLWKGYSMLYHPRFGRPDRNGYTCDTTETADTARLIYSNFVGDATAAKVNVYMMKRTLDSVTSLTTNYGLDQICGTDPTIFSDACTYAPTKMATFINSFCNPASTLTATWNDTCSASSAAVSAAEFPTDSWVAPATFWTIDTAFTIPTSL